jgi:hypothetical protein
MPRHSNDEIAQALYLSSATVKAHVGKILRSSGSVLLIRLSLASRREERQSKTVSNVRKKASTSFFWDMLVSLSSDDRRYRWRPPYAPRRARADLSATARRFREPEPAYRLKIRTAGISCWHGHGGCHRSRPTPPSARRSCHRPVHLGRGHGRARRQGVAGAARHPSPDEARALA